MATTGTNPHGTKKSHGLGSRIARRPGRSVLIALAVTVGLLLPAAGIAGPQEDVSQSVCDAAKTAAGAGVKPAADGTSTLKTGACLRFVTTTYTAFSTKTQVHAATINVPSLLDLNNDNSPDVSAQIQIGTSVEGVTMSIQRLPTSPQSLSMKIEAVAPLPTDPGKEAAFGYDSGRGVEAPTSLVIALTKTVNPATPTQPNRYRLAVTEYTPKTSGASLALVGALYTPVAGSDLGRVDPIAAAIKFTPFPPAVTAFEFAPDAGALTMSSPTATTVNARVTIQKGSVTRQITGLVEKLPKSLSLALESGTGGRRRIKYVASSSIDTVEVTTKGIAMGPLGTPDVKVVVREIPTSLTATLPSASAPFELTSSGKVEQLAFTANNVSLGKYRHLYATITGIPAAPTDKPHTIQPPSETEPFEVAMSNGTSLGSVDIELTEGARLSMPSSVDGVYLRQELDAPAGRGEDAVHGRLTGLRSLRVLQALNWFDVSVDTSAGRPFVIRLDRQTAEKQEFIQGKLTSLRPNTRVSAGLGSITNAISYSAGDSVRPRLDIDTNVGDRLSLHADVPAMPKTLTACVSTSSWCMRDSDKRVAQRNNAHQKAFVSLDVKASQQMTINMLDCIKKNTGTTSVCGQDGYGKWTKGSITFQNIALDAWAEWVTESDYGCDICEPDNILGHLFIDTDNHPVYTDINTDNASGTDLNIDLNGLKAQNRQVWFDRDWSALIFGDGFHTSGSFTCGSNPELEFRPTIPGIDDPWVNVAGYVC